jgi:hypothetical protein
MKLLSLACFLVYNSALIAQLACGTQSVALATKGDTRIASFGTALSDALCWDSEIIFNTLDSWKIGDTPITCAFFETFSSPEKEDIENYKSKLTKRQFLYALQSYGSGAIAQAKLTGPPFRAGSLSFVFPSHPVDFEEESIIVQILYPLQLTFEKMILMITGMTLADFENLTRQKKEFALKMIESSLSKKTTLRTFLRLLEERSAFISEKRAYYAEHPEMLRILDLLEEQFLVYKREVGRVISEMTQNVDDSLVSILFKFIRAENSCLMGLRKFQTIFDLARPQFSGFTNFCFLLDLAKDHKNIFFSTNLVQLESVYAFLESVGYKVQISGRSAMPGQLIVQKSRKLVETNVPMQIIGTTESLKGDKIFSDIFTREVLARFFATLFTQNVEFPAQNPVKVTYYDPLGRLNFDRNKTHCSGEKCPLEIPRCVVVAFLKDDAFCSMRCFIPKLIRDNTRKSHVFDLLKESGELSEQQKDLLRKFAVLCYLRAATLSSAVMHETGFFYRLAHKAIADLLDEISKKSESNGWSLAVKDAESIGIKFDDLGIFFRMYAILKKQYLNELLRNRIKQYDEISDQDDAIFDASERLKGRQEAHIQRIKHCLELADTPHSAYSGLYYELYHSILRRLAIVTLDFYAILKAANFEQKERSPSDDLRAIAQLLKELGEPEHEDEESDSEAENEVGKDKQFIGKQPLDRSSDTIERNEQPEIITPALPKKSRPVMYKKEAFFAGKPYLITLFQAKKKKYFKTDDDSERVHREFQSTDTFKLTPRLKTLFAQEASALEEGTFVADRDSYGRLIMRIAGELNPSIAEKLDIDHLFSTFVDDKRKSCGIIEKEGDLIRVSVPGTLEENGIISVGFFQFVYTQTWVCVHRCFVRYDAHRNDHKYVSLQLRRALYYFLKDHLNDDARFTSVIRDLAKILGTTD